jgi:hypothetical protein
MLVQQQRPFADDRARHRASVGDVLTEVDATNGLLRHPGMPGCAPQKLDLAHVGEQYDDGAKGDTTKRLMWDESVCDQRVDRWRSISNAR